MAAAVGHRSELALGGKRQPLLDGEDCRVSEASSNAERLLGDGDGGDDDDGSVEPS